jgi:hypothetical protein
MSVFHANKRACRSCSLCRRRKLRCNRETPCSNCVRSKNATCVYENQPSEPPRPRLAHRQIPDLGLNQEYRGPLDSIPIDRTSSTSRASTIPTSHSSTSLVRTSTSASTYATYQSAQDLESMKIRIRQLEEQLSKATQKSTQSSTPNSSSDLETTTSRIAGTFHVHHETNVFGQAHFITRSVMHKTRLFGQSHWINGISIVSSSIHKVFCTITRLSKP